jgi:hypothetical protein
MKRQLLQLAILCACGGALQAQEFEYGWHTVEDADNLKPVSFKIRNNQIYSLYLTTPSGDFDADPGAGTDLLSDNTLLNDRLVYMTVTNMDGSHVDAFPLLEGPYIDEAQSDFNFSPDGNIILTGYSDNQTNFDPAGSGAMVYSSNLAIAYVSMYGSDGSYIAHWEYGFDWGTNEINIHDIAVSGDLLYLAGYYAGAIDFDFTAGNDVHTAQNWDGFISRINLTSQTYDWTKTIDGEGGDEANYLKVFQNQLYVNVKSQSDSVDIDLGPNELYLSNLTGGTNQCLGVYDLDGNYVKSLKLDGNGSVNSGGFTIDGAGNIYMLGSNVQYDYIDFDQSANISWIYSSDNSGNFVVKYDNDFNLIWQTSIFSDDNLSFNFYSDLRSTIEVGSEYVAIVLDYFTGELYQSVNFPTPVPAAPVALNVTGADEDMIILALDLETGQIDTTSVYPGGQVRSLDIEISAADELIVRGTFIGSMDLNIYDGIANPETYNALRGFTLKLDWIDYTGLDDLEAGELSVHPIPAYDYLTVQVPVEPASIQIVDMHGKVLINQWIGVGLGTQLDVSELEAGYYFVRAKGAKSGSTYQTKFIKM